MVYVGEDFRIMSAVSPSEAPAWMRGRQEYTMVRIFVNFRARGLTIDAGSDYTRWGRYADCICKSRDSMTWVWRRGSEVMENKKWWLLLARSPHSRSDNCCRERLPRRAVSSKRMNRVSSMAHLPDPLAKSERREKVPLYVRGWEKYTYKPGWMEGLVIFAWL